MWHAPFYFIWWKKRKKLLSVMFCSDWLYPCFEQGDSFLLAAEGIVNIDQVVGEQVIPLAHQPNENMEVVDAVEDEGLVLFKVLFVL